MVTCVAFVALSLVGGLVLLLLLLLWLGATTLRTRRSSSAPPLPPSAVAMAEVQDTMAAVGRLVCAHARVRDSGGRRAVLAALGRVRAQLVAVAQRAVHATAAHDIGALAAEERALVARGWTLAAQLCALLVPTPALDTAIRAAQQHVKTLLQHVRVPGDFLPACVALAVLPRSPHAALASTRTEERARCVATLASLHSRTAAHRAETARLRPAVAAASTRVAAARAAALQGVRDRHDAQQRALAAARADTEAAQQRVAALRRRIAEVAAGDAVAAALGQPRELHQSSSREKEERDVHAFLAGVRDAVAVQAHHEEALLRAHGVAFEPRASMFLRRAPPRVADIVARLARDDVLDPATRAHMAAHATALLRHGCAPSQVPEALVIASTQTTQQKEGGRPRASSLIAFRAGGPAAPAVPRAVDALVAKATAQCGAPLLAQRFAAAVLALRVACRRAHRAATADDLTAAEHATLAAPDVHRAARAPLPAAVRARPLVREHVPRLLAPPLWPVPLDRARRFAPATAPAAAPRVPPALAAAARELWAEVLFADDPKAPKHYPHLFSTGTTSTSTTSMSTSSSRNRRPSPLAPPVPPPPVVVRRPVARRPLSMPSSGSRTAVVAPQGSPPARHEHGSSSTAALRAWLDRWLRRLGPGRARALVLHLRYVALANYTARRVLLARLARRTGRPGRPGRGAVRQLLVARLLLALRACEDRARPRAHLGPEYRDCGAYYYLPDAWPGGDDPLAAAREMPRVQHSLVPWAPLFAHAHDERPAAGAGGAAGSASRAVPLWARARELGARDRLRLVWHIAAAVRATRVAALRRLHETVDALRAF